MGLYGSPRRYYLRKRLQARERQEFALEGLWRYKQEREPATAMLAGIVGLPYAAQLSAAGYEAFEDLLDADADELVQVAGLTPTEAADVVAAFALALAQQQLLLLVTP